MTSHRNRILGLLATAAFLHSGGAALAQSSSGSGVDLVLDNVSVVDTRSGEVATGMAVVIADGMIRDVVEASSVDDGGGAIIVDAGGKYVVPGFLDMHAHGVLPPGGASAGTDDHSHEAGTEADQQNYWRLMIANGVTGFRQMSGSKQLIALSREINAASAAGEIDAPEVLQTPGDIYLGQAPTPEAAREFVKAQLAAGADFMKLIAGPRDGVLAALDEASRQGMDVAGHLPVSITTHEAVEAGWDSFEHLGAGWGFMLDCAGAAPAIREKLSGPRERPSLPQTYLFNPMLYDGARAAPIYGAILDTFDEDRCRQLAQLFRDEEVWQVPTLIRIRTMDYGGDPLYRNDENLKYLNPEIRAIWEKMGEEFETSIPADVVAILQGFYEKQKEVTGMMKEEGVDMLAGSDLGGIWVLPGFGLHQEFEELAGAGFTPLEVLQATTLNGARFLGREATMGSVEEGKEADLVLLDANPLEDVANLHGIAGVVLNGKYFSAADLDEMKAEVAASYGR